MAQYNQLNVHVEQYDFQDIKTQYNEWVDKVAKIVYASIAIDLDDLPDENYRINFDDGMTPEEMAKIITDPINSLIDDTVSSFFN